MSETIGGIAPLNWPKLVAEAIRRRKAEKLTQKEHAALASVSAPTIIAFDRGERTLSLNKAIDILRVVGLVEEPTDMGSQEIFVQQAFARWRELAADLPKASPGRFPSGWYRIDYTLEGDIKEIEPHAFINVMREAVLPHTGWPMFWSSQERQEMSAHEADGVIECWLAPGDKAGFDRPLYDAAHCDFWRAAPSGRLVLIRGYQEDAQETIPPGTMFDTTLPIWRLTEAFLHAARLARLITRDPDKAVIRLRALYTGLQGRDLRAWASPLSVDYFGGGRSRSDEVILEATAPVANIEAELGRHVFPLVVSLFERFGVTGLSNTVVEAEIARMRQNNFGGLTRPLKG
jgi:transcriptional regulator with XRE-family HTH domain